MSDAVIVYGATLERSRDGGATWQKYPECIGVALPRKVKNFIDVTNLDSPGRMREYKPGLGDIGEFGTPMNFTPQGYQMCLDDELLGDTGTPIRFRTTLPAAPSQSTGSRWIFEGFPSIALDEATDPEAKVTMTLTIRGTGDFDHEPGALAA